MTHNQRTACASAVLAALASAALAGPLTSVSLNGSITFTSVQELNNPNPVGRSGIATTDGWRPSPLTLSDPAPRVSSVNQFRSGDGPLDPDGQAPRPGDSWGLAMLAAIDLLETGDVSGEAGHRLDISFRDATLGASAFVLRGVLDLSITGQIQTPNPATQKAFTAIRAEAYAKTDAGIVQLIDFGTVHLQSSGDRVVNRSLWSTFEVLLSGAPGSSSTVEMWIDIGFSTSLSAVPAPSGALCLLGLGGLIAFGRRR